MVDVTIGAAMSPKLQGETLGERIANARKAHNWRKVDLRRRVGEYLSKDVNHYYPLRWEAGTETPGDEYMSAIAAVTGFSTEEFYAGLGKVPKSIVAAANKSKRVADAVERFRNSGKYSPYQPDEVRFLEACAAVDVPSLGAALLGYRLALAKDTATRERYYAEIKALETRAAKPESSIPKKPTKKKG